jgi:type III secretory pathway component EscU
MKQYTPIIMWLTGITVLIVILAVNGGFQREVIAVVAVAFVVMLLFGFVFSRTTGLKKDRHGNYLSNHRKGVPGTKKNEHEK